MPALTLGLVDVPLSPLNQTPSDTMGPLGRLQHLINAQIHRYEPHYVGTGGVVPAKVKVEPRDAFNSLPTTARSVVDGTVASATWTLPELLNSLGSQLVSICGSIPRVFNGSTWSYYPNTRTLTQKLTEQVFHTSQHTIQAPTSAWLSGVTCSVWTESINGAGGPATTSFVGFKSDNQAWVVAPQVLDDGVGASFFAKAVTDGSHFFVFFNVDATHIEVWCFDVHGALLAQSGITVATSVCGAWDVTAAVTPSPNAGTVLLASAVSYGETDGVKFTAVGFNGSTVTLRPSTDATLNCRGPLAFIKNDLGNGLAYLATTVTTENYTVWGYEVTALAQSHEFNTGQVVSSIDSIAGFAFSDANGVGVTLSIGALPPSTSPALHGPPLDPAFRFLRSVQCDRNGTNTVLKTTQSVCQVSTAFAIDGQYYVYAYYQSGSGIGLQPTKQSVTITGGDYMIGAATQPITIAAGDSTSGSPLTLANVPGGGGVTLLTGTYASTAIQAGDTAVAVSASGLSAVGIPDGTPLLKWQLAGFTAFSGNVLYSELVVGPGASALNTTFEIVAGSGTGTTFYTMPTDIFGNGVTGATFTHAGNFQINPVVMYLVDDLTNTVTSNQVASFYVGGKLTVTGATDPTNDITNQTIKRMRSPAGGFPAYGAAIPAPNAATSSIVTVAVTTQTASQTSGVFAAVATPNLPNHWFFASGEFDSSYVGADLVVASDIQVPTNVGTYPITASDFPTSVTTGDATTLLPQVFAYPYPSASIQLTTQVPYTFKFASLTPNYTFQGAIVSVQGATNTANNGTYQIIQINADGSFIATPTNGLVNQGNEAFTGAQTVTIYFNPGIAPEFQPTWLIIPITGSQPVAGRFEYGLAYADWRVEEDLTYGPNLYPMSLSSPAVTTAGLQTVLPYRAQNVTASVVEVTAAGEVDIGEESFDSTVGLKAFTLSTTSGQSYANSDELLIPGPMATVFTASGFLEDNFNLALEAPFLVAQSAAASGQLALTQGATYFYVAVAEGTDENGNRIYSPPSPALQVSMSGTNNVATIGGRLMFPLSTAGQPISNTWGPTTRLTGLSLYRTVWINGEPTTQRCKITDDLNVNGLAPISTLNPSGFSFPDSFTWNYLDQNPDPDLDENEILYTDKGFLPRYPAPAFSRGVGSWKNREWVIGYDKAIWMSGEKTEGDAIWFNPAFRYVLPTDDEPLGLSPMEDFLVVVCSRSVWYIPAAQFPDATGANGTLPTPVQLPFQNGSVSGFTQTIREGVAYDSTAGGVWCVTRNLDNVWLSHDAQDSIASPITGLALDEQQRLFVLQQSGPVMVYDGIPAAWYEWDAPTAGVLLASYQGQAVYQDTSTVNVVVPGQGADIVNGTTYGIAPDITLAPLNFGNVRGLKRVWEFQAVGQYLGPHRLNVVLSYPEDDQPPTVYDPFTPTEGVPYVYPFNPLQEEASQYGIRLYADFVGVSSPGASFSLEMVSAQVGLDPVGVNKRPAVYRLIAKT